MIFFKGLTGVPMIISVRNCYIFLLLSKHLGLYIQQIQFLKQQYAYLRRLLNLHEDVSLINYYKVVIVRVIYPLLQRTNLTM